MVIDLDQQPESQAELGRLLGISQPSVSALFARGVLSAEMTVHQCLLACFNHYREMAAGRSGGDLNLAEERAALAKAQRERIELQNAVTRGELAPVSAIEEVLAKAGAKVAGILDAIPGMLRRRSELLTAADLELVAQEVAKARNIAAAVTLADLVDEPEAEDESESEAA